MLLQHYYLINPDEKVYATTDSSPDFLGLTDPAGPWSRGFVGEDIVIGVIDTIDRDYPCSGIRSRDGQRSNLRRPFNPPTNRQRRRRELLTQHRLSPDERRVCRREPSGRHLCR